MQILKWRNPYDEEENHQYGLLTSIDMHGDPGMTLQAPAEEQDINVIMKRFGITDGSALPRWHDPLALYGDFTNIPTDPVETAELLRQGEIEFAKLPAEVRRQFDSGAHLFNWIQDPNNQDEAIKLGLMTKTPPAAASLDDVQASLQQLVSSSTSSDKEPLVPTTYTVAESNQRTKK